MTVVLRTQDELDAWLARAPGPRGVVLTMGALHAGHEALMRAARAEVGTGSVIVTVFVNPTQFGPNEDFAKYPRTLDADVERCRAQGVDAVFTPDVDVVYPPGMQISTYEPGPLGSTLEGAARPGHFAGVLQVVARLLMLTRADVTCFGEKDYQQLALVRTLPSREPALAHCRFVGVPIVRDADGLALSSRNRYLTADQRAAALAIPASLSLVQRMLADGASVGEAQTAAHAFLDAAPGITLDYLVISSNGLDAPPSEGEARALVAARVGETRLLDNTAVHIHQAVKQ